MSANIINMFLPMIGNVLPAMFLIVDNIINGLCSHFCCVSVNIVVQPYQWNYDTIFRVTEGRMDRKGYF